MSIMHNWRCRWLTLLGPSVGLLFSTSIGALPTTASADPVNDGQQAFTLCSACHQLNGENAVGPYLNGVVGRHAGAVGGFRYSRALKSSDVVWTAEALDKYLQNPQVAIPGNRMPFSGIAQADKRADIIAYLATIK
jgi:cytochrome c